MHGCSSGSAFLVNAEVDSMGGIVDGGVGIGVKTSPRQAAIEKAQAKLRQEYDVREERRRELEFLEKGGNPLDFKFGNAASVSFQSTSLTDRHVEHYVTSEAKGSFALTPSPHGDSVESSGRPVAPTVCEPNSADNFDGENDLCGGKRKSKYPSRQNNIAPAEQSSQIDETYNTKESEDSAIFLPYVRRNRSRPNRDGVQSSSIDAVQRNGGHGSSLLVCGGLRDAMGSISEANNIKDQNIPSISNQKSTTSNGGMVSRIEISNAQSNMELKGVQAVKAAANLPRGGLPRGRMDALEPIWRDNQHDHPSEIDAQKAPIDMASGGSDPVGVKEQVLSAGPECLPHAGTEKTGNETGSAKLNGCSEMKRDVNEGQNGNVAIRTKGLDSEPSCTQNSLDVNNHTYIYMDYRNNGTNEIIMKQTSKFDRTQNFAPCEMGNKKNETIAVDGGATINDVHNYVHQNHSGNASVVKVEEGILRISELQDDAQCPNIKGEDQNEHATSDAGKKVGNVLNEYSNTNRENIYPGGPQDSMGCFFQELPESNMSDRNSSAAPDPQSCFSSQSKLVDGAHKDSVLEEAQIIEAKRKRIAELSVGTVLSESGLKSHWDFVLEEMAWLANDFAQERVWKMTAAAQICNCAALTSWLRVEEQNKQWALKKVACTQANAVMQFWHSAKVFLNNNDQYIGLKNCKQDSRKFDENEASKDKIGELDKVTCKGLEIQNFGKNIAHEIWGYAVRFLKCNSSPVPSFQAEAPATPERVADIGTLETSWDDRLAEESLFYAVRPGAMETYRISIESHVVHCEKTGSSMQEEVDTSMYDTAADFRNENAYDEVEAETSIYYLHGVFGVNKSTKHDQRKRKKLMKSYSARSYELGTDLPFGISGIGSQQNTLMGKRPTSITVGSIPTKRMRTASRQRVISPFSAGAAGVQQAPAKTEASSGDTSSFQDDQGIFLSESQIQKSVEVESVRDFEHQLPYEYSETSTKLKKAKHLGSAFENRWQLDCTIHNELKDNSKKRLESHRFDSNESSGLYGQHLAKKPKIMKQSLDSAFDNMAPVTGSVPSPAASQMSNMSNTNRFMKLISGRDRGRKAKSLKLSAGHPGSENPWSLYEDQALVVLVHDMGPNWELVSDAINGTLQFKCTYRKPKECKERHRILMDKGAGDGADSAEDSGSSQSYPSTLPGIPKGSARQLFQCLQGPMEEDTIKSHFAKIIIIGKNQHYRSQGPKQIAAAHNSHVIALSKVCPNNLNGGVLTPLDLCDMGASNPDVLSLGYHGTHAGGLAMPNQVAVASMLPTCANSSLPGSPGTVLDNNSSSSSGQLNAPVRDGKYSAPRTSLPIDEQQRMQHHNQMFSSRNLQQNNLSVSGALCGIDHGVCMLPGGNGMGMMPGMNRSMPLSRPGFQGMASSSILSSGSVLSSSMVGMPSPVNMHPAPDSGQGNSMMRPCEPLHMRPGHPDHQRQMMVSELQMQQVTQGNSQGIPAFNGLSSAFPNQAITLSVQTYPVHPQQHHQMPSQQSHMMSNPHPHSHNHTTGSQQQAYAIRYPKERQMQQRILQQQQQQQQFAGSGALLPHIQSQSQLPISSSKQNSSQIQPQTSSQPAPLPSLTPSSPIASISVQRQQQKQTMPNLGLSRSPQTGPSGLPNQMGKQRQRQLQHQRFQQSGRHHPQQRQFSQSTQQAKILKGIEQGNTMVHQNLPVDHCQLNGLFVPQGTQGAKKGEQFMHLMQSQGLNSGTGASPLQPSKPLAPQSSDHSQSQQKLFPGSMDPSLKQQQIPSHSDIGAQGQIAPVPTGHVLSATHQEFPTAIMASNHQNLQTPLPHQKQVSQAQPSVQRMLQQNQVNSDLPTKSQTNHGHTDQQPVNNVSKMGTSTTTAMPLACNDSANVTPVVSNAVALQWKASETLYGSRMSNPASQGGSIGSPPRAHTAGTEQMSSVCQGLGQRQVLGGLSQHGHNAGTQWHQQQQPQLQQSTSPTPPSQQLLQPQEQSPRQQPQLQQQSQHQTQHLQSVQGSL